nr:MAG TPA: hypothetical protein [Caudoviricetes sp.]
MLGETPTARVGVLSCVSPIFMYEIYVISNYNVVY